MTRRSPTRTTSSSSRRCARWARTTSWSSSRALRTASSTASRRSSRPRPTTRGSARSPLFRRIRRAGVSRFGPTSTTRKSNFEEERQMSELVADYFLKRLREWGVHRIYGYPGDGINAFLGALDRADGDPEIIQTRHEEMAAFMACGHAKFTQEVGVCMATSGVHARLSGERRHADAEVRVPLASLQGPPPAAARVCVRADQRDGALRLEATRARERLMSTRVARFLAGAHPEREFPKLAPRTLH